MHDKEERVSRELSAVAAGFTVNNAALINGGIAAGKEKLRRRRIVIAVCSVAIALLGIAVMAGVDLY